MKGYVDGYVLPIPKKNVRAYQKLAQDAGKIWMEHGALQYVEATLEDLKPMKDILSFPQQIKSKPGETVVFAWVMFKSRAHRDKVNAKVMKDPRITNAMDENKMPMDPKRMAYGGFIPLVQF